MNQKQKNLIIWGAIATILSIFVITKNTADAVLTSGFITKFFAFIFASALGLAGALIGDFIRKFAHPDSFSTNGGMWSIIKIKVFWAIVPQIVGLVSGVFLGITIIVGNVKF